MEKHREKAWSYLTDLEQKSIYLTLGQGLSGNEACEIIGMVHYKYLELKARSETFFKLLSDFFEKYPNLTSGRTPITPGFRDYLYGCIEKRLSVKEASIYAGGNKWTTTSVKQPEIKQGLQSLKNSTNKHDQALFSLVQEFDRWNNFRILPVEWQAPSPYKRKSNRQVKAYFGYLKSMNQDTLLRLSQTLWYKGKKQHFTVLVNEDLYDIGYLVLPIQLNKKVLKDLTNRRLYIFEEQPMAEIFALMILQQPKVLTQKNGLRFWKEYADVVRKAINYESIDHTTKIRDFYDDEFKENYKPTK